MSYLSSQESPKPVRPDFVRLVNRIVGVRRLLSFQWNGQTASLNFTHEHLASRGGWKLGVVLGGHDLNVSLNRLPELTWVSPTLAGIELQGLPPELTCALIEASLGEIFEALTKEGIDVRITSVQSFNFLDEPNETIEWRVDYGSETGWIRGAVAGDDKGLEHLANLLQRAPIAAVIEDMSLPMPVGIVAGAMPISLAELQQVEVHDVLLADLTPFAKGQICELRSGKQTFGNGTLTDKIFTLKQLSTMATNAPVNDLEIELTFVVGQSTLTVGELRSLAPGFVFELAGVCDGVTICANGKEIGKGELLEVGDRVGVRVTAFSAL